MYIALTLKHKIMIHLAKLTKIKGSNKYRADEYSTSCGRSHAARTMKQNKDIATPPDFRYWNNEFPQEICSHCKKKAEDLGMKF